MEIYKNEQRLYKTENNVIYYLVRGSMKFIYK